MGYFITPSGELITIQTNGYDIYIGKVTGIIQIDLYEPFFLFEEIKS